MSRTRYFVFRSFQTVFLLLFILTFLFFFFRLLPGNYLDLMVFQGANPEQIEAIKQAWGLDDPLYVQYYRYIANAITLDFGLSLRYREDVLTVAGRKMFNSFILVAPAITTSYIIGGILGTIMGSIRGSRLEKYGTVAVLGVGTMPIFFFSILAITVFSVKLGWFPTGGIRPIGMSFGSDASFWALYTNPGFVYHYTLPFLVIVIRYLAYPLLIMRTSSVEVAGQGFFYYHRITGIPRLARLKHLGKHASLPLITLYPISIAQAMGGLVLLEVVFNWPGIGFELVQSVLARDTPMVQFIIFMIAAGVIIGNFAVDIVYGVIDPRISAES